MHSFNYVLYYSSVSFKKPVSDKELHGMKVYLPTENMMSSVSKCYYCIFELVVHGPKQPICSVEIVLSWEDKLLKMFLLRSEFFKISQCGWITCTCCGTSEINAGIFFPFPIFEKISTRTLEGNSLNDKSRWHLERHETEAIKLYHGQR